jgi:hypothetical protein
MAGLECNWHKNGCRSFNEFIKTERRQMECDYRYGITNEIVLTQVQTRYADAFSDSQRSSEIGKYRFRITKNHSIPVYGRPVVIS